MRLRFWIGLLLLGGMASPAHAGDSVVLEDMAGVGRILPIDFDLAKAESESILVIGQRLRGSVIGNAPPEMQLDERDIASFGASNVSELVDALGPQTSNGSGAGQPVVLVNGRRISSFEEIRDLPTEALLRVDILPPEVALRYGYRSDRRVVNIVLRPQYRSVIGEAGLGFATEGGRTASEGSVNLARIGPRGRSNFSANYQRTGTLLEGEREITGGAGIFRSLLPGTEQASLNGTVMRDISQNVSATLNARLEARDSQARIGAGFDLAGGPGPLESRPLLRDARTRSAHAGVSMGGTLEGWQWLFTGNLDHSWHAVRTDRPAATAEFPGPRRRERASFESGSAGAQLLVNGALASHSAGDILASLRVGWEKQTYDSRQDRAGLPRDFRLSRSQSSGQFTLDIPLLGGGSGALAGIGELSVNLDAELTGLSDFGTLRRFGYGARWAPIPQVTFTASIVDEDSAPNAQSLGEPAILTPNVRVFDFASGRTADISRLDGGNPFLLQESRRRTRVGLSLRPLSRTNLIVTATYSANRTRNPVASLSVPTPELEAAFPDRFVRDPDGRLLRIDARPVNFDRAERRELRWGGNLTTLLGSPLRASSAGPDPLPQGGAGPTADTLRRLAQSESERRGRLQLAAYHSWRFRDQMLVRPGGPRLDFLNGSAVGSRGGRPRHEIEFQAGLYRGGYGARLSANWQSGTRVRTRGDDGAPGRTLSFSDHSTVNMRLFASLGDRPALVRRAPWLRGSRISLDVDNLFNARPRVRDEAGLTPPGLQPAYLDPLGRSVRITFRKLF